MSRMASHSYLVYMDKEVLLMTITWILNFELFTEFNDVGSLALKLTTYNMQRQDVVEACCCSSSCLCAVSTMV